MKFFKSTILAMLGMAVALTSCSDDDDYTPAGQKAGVYFPNTQATEVQILPTESSVDIAIDRTKGAPSTVNVTAEGTDGLFVVPSTVSFTGEESSTKLTIAYNPEDLTIGQTYTIKLTLEGPANVGLASQEFKLYFGPALVTVPFEEGKGQYLYGNPWWTGAYTENDITYTYDETNPGKRTITISDWGANGIDFTITCDDWTPDADGRIVVTTPEIMTGIVNAGEDVACMDVRAWGPKYGFNTSTDPVSYYDTNTGVFYLQLIYYPLSKASQGSYYWQGYEEFHMNGYPDYTLEVAYDGMVTDRDGNMKANATIIPGADVKTVKAAIVAGEDPNAGVAAILNGAAGVQEFAYAEEIPVSFEVSEGGMHTIVAVTFDANGEAQEAAYDTFQLFIGANPDADWEDVGLCDYRDGWIIPAFSYSDGTSPDNLEFMYTVPLQAHKTEAGVYRLVQPYGDDFPLAANNVYPAKRNIQFAIIDNLPLVAPQPCGFGAKSWGKELTVGNLEGNYYYNEGFSVAEIKAGLKPEFLSTCEEGVVTFPYPYSFRPIKVNGVTTGIHISPVKSLCPT